MKPKPRKRHFVLSINTTTTDRETIAAIKHAMKLFERIVPKGHSHLVYSTLEVKSGARVQAAIKALRKKLRSMNYHATARQQRQWWFGR